MNSVLFFLLFRYCGGIAELAMEIFPSESQRKRTATWGAKQPQVRFCVNRYCAWWRWAAQQCNLPSKVSLPQITVLMQVCLSNALLLLKGECQSSFPLLQLRDLSHWPTPLCWFWCLILLHRNSRKLFIFCRLIFCCFSRVKYLTEDHKIWSKSKLLHVIYGHVSSRTGWKSTTSFQWQRVFYTLTPASVTTVLVYSRLLHLCHHITLTHVKHQAGLWI